MGSAGSGAGAWLLRIAVGRPSVVVECKELQLAAAVRRITDAVTLSGRAPFDNTRCSLSPRAHHVKSDQRRGLLGGQQGQGAPDDEGFKADGYYC